MQKKATPIRAVASSMPLLRKFVIAIGIGLTLAALRLDILRQWRGLGISYWTEWVPRVFLIGLIAAAAGFLIANVILEEEDRFLTAVSGIGTILLGYFLFLPISTGPTHLGDVDLGPRIAVAGSALIVLGALPYRALSTWKRSHKRPDSPLYIIWLAAIAGLGVVIASLRQDVVSAIISSPNSLGFTGKQPRYWSSVGLSGGRALGYVMLITAVLAIVLALGSALLRAPLLGRWALAGSLFLLGLSLYYPISLVFFRDLNTFASGGGLALEGSLLASAAALVAVAGERGAIDLRRLAIPRLVAAVVGAGLVLAGTWSDLWGMTGNLWAEDKTMAGFPAVLAVLAIALVVLNFVRRRAWILPAVGVIGWILLGYFGYELAWVTPRTNLLGPAAWVGAAGGALMGVSALSLYSLSSLRRRLPRTTGRGLAAWTATAAGTGLTVIALWLSTEPDQKSKKQLFHLGYWDFRGDHSLGIVMLVLAGVTLAALLAVLVVRFSALHSLVLAASLALLGITLFLPMSEAFNHLGSLRSGAWLALVGSLVAGAGAITLALPDQLRAAEAEAEEVEEEAAPARGRVANKGKKHRVPEMRRNK